MQLLATQQAQIEDLTLAMQEMAKQLQAAQNRQALSAPAPAPQEEPEEERSLFWQVSDAVDDVGFGLLKGICSSLDMVDEVFGLKPRKR